MIQGIKRQISPNIIKTFVLVFVGMAFMNSIIFGITEYRDSKKLILREFKYISLSISRGLADSVWRNNKSEMSEIVDELLNNYNISAIKVINYETNFVEEFKIKQGRKDYISHKSDLIFTYDNKKVKVGKLYIYTDKVAIFHRAKKTLALILLKTLLEIFIVVILIFWGFKKLFTDYLYDIKSAIQDRTYIPVNLNMKNSLPLLERALRDVLNRFFKLYFKQKDEKPESAPNIKKVQPVNEVEKPKIEMRNDLSYVLGFLNPNKDFFQKFFSSIFIYSKSAKQSGGDIYLFIEVEKSKESLLLILDYGENININSAEISIILKDVEKDLMIKYSVNNRLFALGKIIDFMENKIKSKLIENGVKGVDEVEFKGLAMHYDKVNQKVEYSSKGVLLIKEVNNKLVTYNDTGVYKDIIMQHQQMGEEKREYVIDIETGSNLYIVTDGILKQVKKDKEKEVIGHRGFMEILGKVTKEPFNSQETHLKDEFEKVKGDKPQSDNITVIGFNF